MATAGTGYNLHLLESRTRVYEHSASGVKVWKQAIDFSEAGQVTEGCVVLFLYVSASSFEEILEKGFSIPELWHSMMRKHTSGSIGIVAAQREPSQLQAPALASRDHCVAILVAAAHISKSGAPWEFGTGEEAMDLCTVRFPDCAAMVTAAAANCVRRLRTVVENKARDLGATNPESLACLNDLGMHLLFRNESEEAEIVLSRAYDSCGSTLGPDNVETLRSLEFLAGLIWSRGRLEESEVLVRRLRDIREQRLGTEHVASLRAVAMLAALLAEQGKPADAEPLFRQALAGYEKLGFGREDARTARLVQDLAKLPRMEREGTTAGDAKARRETVRSLTAQGRSQDAEAASRDLVAMLENEKGKDDVATLAACHELAKLLRSSSIIKKGAISEAELLFKRVLAGREAALGPNHLETVQTANDLAVFEDDKGSPETAEPLYRRSLEAWESILGPDHPDTLVSVNNLGVLLKQRGQLEEAEGLYRRVLQGREKNLGSEHSETLIAANNLAKLLASIGGDGSSGAGSARLEEAERLFRRALDGRERTLGDAAPETLQSLDNLGEVLHARGDLKAAERIVRRAVHLRQGALGPGDLSTLQSAHNLAVVLQALGRPGEAEPFALHAVRGWEAELGWEHETTLAGAANLALLLRAAGKLDKAEACQRRIVRAREARFGRDDLDTLASLSSLSVLLSSRRKKEEAEAISTRVLQAYQMQLGPTHPDTLQCEKNLALMRKSLGMAAAVSE